MAKRKLEKEYEEEVENPAKKAATIVRTGRVTHSNRGLDCSTIDDFEPQDFPHDKIPLDVFGILFGKRRRGKTIYLQWILSEMWQYYPGGAYVFTQTKNNYFWQQHCPEEAIFDGFQGEVVKRIIAEQAKKCEEFKNKGKPDECPYVLIIMDDIISDLHLNWEEELIRLAVAGRHFKIGCWLISQDAKGVGPKIRSQADVIGISYTTSKRVMDCMKEDYAYLFEDPRLLPVLIRKWTKDHQFLIIDQNDTKYDLKEVFFKDLAPDPKTHKHIFKLGSDKFWADRQCDWERQLKIYKNVKRIHDMDKEEWLPVAKRQRREEKNDLQDMEDKFYHNIQYMAAKKDQEAFSNAFKKKYDYFDNSKELVEKFKMKLAQGYHRPII
jgi:hypothetical protein